MFGAGLPVYCVIVLHWTQDSNISGDKMQVFFCTQCFFGATSKEILAITLKENHPCQNIKNWEYKKYFQSSFVSVCLSYLSIINIFVEKMVKSNGKMHRSVSNKVTQTHCLHCTQTDHVCCRALSSPQKTSLILEKPWTAKMKLKQINHQGQNSMLRKHAAIFSCSRSVSSVISGKYLCANVHCAFIWCVNV